MGRIPEGAPGVSPHHGDVVGTPWGRHGDVMGMRWGRYGDVVGRTFERLPSVAPHPGAVVGRQWGHGAACGGTIRTPISGATGLLGCCRGIRGNDGLALSERYCVGVWRPDNGGNVSHLGGKEEIRLR